MYKTHPVKFWEPSSKLVFTCPACQSYSYFESHCRYCGRRYCNNCVHVQEDTIDQRYRLPLCEGIPEGKETILKSCTKCIQEVQIRKHMVLWAKFLLYRYQHAYEFNSFHRVEDWLYLRQSESVPLSLKLSAGLLIEAYDKTHRASSFEFMSREADSRTCLLENQIAAASSSLLFWDICNRSPKFQSTIQQKQVRLSCPLPLLLSACQSDFCKDITRPFKKTYKSKIPSIRQFLSPEYNEAIAQSTDVTEAFLHSLQSLQSHDIDTTNPKNSLGVSPFLIYAINEHKDTTRVMQELVQVFLSSEEMPENLCKSLCDTEIIYDLKSVRITGVTLAQITNNLQQHKLTCLRLTTDDYKQLFCFCNTDPTLIQAGLYLDSKDTYDQHWNNTTFTDHSSVFILEAPEDICSGKNNIIRASEQSKVISGTILVVKGYLLKRRIRFKEEVLYTVDRKGTLLLLGLRPYDEIDQAIVLESQTSRSKDINKKILENFKSKENKYWLARVLGAQDETARQFANTTIPELEDYFVLDF